MIVYKYNFKHGLIWLGYNLPYIVPRGMVHELQNFCDVFLRVIFLPQ